VRKYFGTDGVRGKANVFPMTSEFALLLGKAIAQTFKNGNKKHKIVVGKDTRISSYMFENAIVSGICSMGVDAIMLGVLPTPAIAFITRSLRADAGIVISASHNPYDDNGIKFFSNTGFKLNDGIETEIENIIDTESFNESSSEVGKAYRIETAIGRYVEYTKGTFDKNYDLKGLKIVLDCANGATYKVAPMAFEELGAEVYIIGDEPDGYNINDNCGAVYPARVAEKVVELGADLGISFDGDGDRVIFADEKGNIVNGDHILGICAQYMHSKGLLNGDTVVATVMSNIGLEKTLKGLGIDFIRSGVGDRYVIEEMLKGGYNLGGEQSGHIIFSDYNSTGDGMISAFQLLRVMVNENKPLSELAAFVEICPQVLKNFVVSNKVPIENLKETRRMIDDYESRFNGKGRILVRYSGTENKLRVMVEGEDLNYIRGITEEVGRKAVDEINKNFTEKI